jgi:hypothetical protein
MLVEQTAADCSVSLEEQVGSPGKEGSVLRDLRNLVAPHLREPDGPVRLAHYIGRPGTEFDAAAFFLYSSG